MTRTQLDAEATTRTTLAHATQLFQAGIITRADLERIKQALIYAHQPPISSLNKPTTTG